MRISVNQNIKLGSNVYHVQTEYYRVSKKIVTNIFKGGMIIKRLEKEIDTEENIEEQTRNFHEIIVKRIRSIYKN
ncbi:hypothetical protein Dester_0644 [Desulfurobacterium thermolithotrophum DSM 11699]|uniref:Uncharacterized protein n=1 Tax=Desulfurobacterium thermolithotrophum (strain DSM 11699 / BSA) TaxID=868864 RepID=F0S372_DESTD|nr:hypothetical protein [Desulfurobacterium thermolithotrophum]ADY73294.1 hypothetical protein Dester_0644 [Desulfurobacterium thermolithotrophum DSM 11699]